MTIAKQLSHRKTALDEQFARLGAKPEPAAPGPMPAQQATAKRWDAGEPDAHCRDEARPRHSPAVDGIPDTARIRTMISLWQDDHRIRAGVDKLARSRHT